MVGVSTDPSFAGRPGLREVVRRRWKYAPPPWVMYDALVEERSRWLIVEPGEPSPAVSASSRAELVVLEPWLDPAVAAMEVRIAADGPGSAATVIAYADADELDPDTRRRIRHRLGVCFGAALRDWVDEPHW